MSHPDVGKDICNPTSSKKVVENKKKKHSKMVIEKTVTLQVYKSRIRSKNPQNYIYKIGIEKPTKGKSDKTRMPDFQCQVPLSLVQKCSNLFRWNPHVPLRIATTQEKTPGIFAHKLIAKAKKICNQTYPTLSKSYPKKI